MSESKLSISIASTPDPGPTPLLPVLESSSERGRRRLAEMPRGPLEAAAARERPELPRRDLLPEGGPSREE